MKMAGKPLHACYFTTPGIEIKLAKGEGFSLVKATGRMFASIRIAYKFGKTVGRIYSQLLEKINRHQKFYSGISRTVAGHLIITASK